MSDVREGVRNALGAALQVYISDKGMDDFLAALSAAGLVIVPIAELTRIGDGLFEEMSAWNVGVRALLDSNPMQAPLAEKSDG